MVYSVKETLTIGTESFARHTLNTEYGETALAAHYVWLIFVFAARPGF